MLNKLAFKNVKRSLNDHLIYFITMVMVTALMLSFNSLLFSESVQTLWNGGGLYTGLLILVTVFIVFIVVWLVHYMVRFMANKRSSEFGTYLLLGFRKSQIAKLFLYENLLIGIVAFFVGIVPGIIVQQVLMKLLYIIVDETFFARFELNMDTFIMTAAVFCFSYLFALIGNSRHFRKLNVAEMMKQKQKNDELSTKTKKESSILFFFGVLYMLFFALSSKILDLTVGVILLLIIGLVIAVYFIYAGVSAFLIRFINKGNPLIWKNNNIFVLRQLSSKFKTMRFTLGTLTLLFMIALVGCSCAMMLNAFQSTQAEEKWPFDISVFSPDPTDDFSDELELIKHENENCVPHTYRIYQNGSAQMTDYLLSNIRGVNEYTYFPKDTFMKLSDYNKLRKMLGYEKVTLNHGQYLIHIKGRMRQYAEQFSNAQTLMINSYQLSCNGIYTEGFGQNRHNGADYILVVEDQFISAMQPYYSVLAVNTDKNISKQAYDALLELQLIKPLSNDTLNRYGIGTDHIAVNISNVYVKKYDTLWMKSTLSAAIFPLLYIGLVCVCVALTILSVQQLSDIEKQKKNYSVLKKIGSNNSLLSKTLFKQTVTYYLLPYVIAVAISVGIDSFISKNFASISGVLLPQWIYFGISLLFFSGIYLLYYFVTYSQLKHSLLRRR